MDLETSFLHDWGPISLYNLAKENQFCVGTSLLETDIEIRVQTLENILMKNTRSFSERSERLEEN